MSHHNLARSKRWYALTLHLPIHISEVL
jgi:hypothetical protein